MNSQLAASFEYPATLPPETLTDEQRSSLRESIKEMLIREDAALVAHYYTDPDIQSLAEEIIELRKSDNTVSSLA